MKVFACQKSSWRGGIVYFYMWRWLFRERTSDGKKCFFGSPEASISRICCKFCIKTTATTHANATAHLLLHVLLLFEKSTNATALCIWKCCCTSKNSKCNNKCKCKIAFALAFVVFALFLSKAICKCKCNSNCKWNSKSNSKSKWSFFLFPPLMAVHSLLLSWLLL